MNMIIQRGRRAYSVVGTSLNLICPICGKFKSAHVRRGFGSMLCVCASMKKDAPMRRKSFRRNMSLVGAINHGKEGGVFIENISLGGVGISVNRVDSLMRIGDSVLLSIFCGNGKISMNAIVRNVRNGRTGLEFAACPPEILSSIYSIMASGSRSSDC